MSHGYRPRYHVPRRISEGAEYPAVSPFTLAVFLVEGGFRYDNERRVEAHAFLARAWSMRPEDIETMVSTAQQEVRLQGANARDVVTRLMET